MKQRLISMAVLTAMVLGCMTGCGEKDTKVNSNSESESSVTSSADESKQAEDATTEVISNADESKQDENTTTEVVSNTVSIPSSDDDFKIDDRGVLIEYTGEGGDVVVPDGVISIGRKPFWNSITTLTSVTLPDSVKVIQDQGFFGCRNLTSITIPDGIAEIGGDAFGYCDSLTSLTYKGVTYSNPDELRAAVHASNSEG